MYRAVATLLTMAAVMAALLRVILGRYAARAAAARRASAGEAKGGERRRPRPARRVDEVEVVVAGDVDDGDAAGVGAGRRRVRSGHDVVGAAADDDDVDAVGDGGGGDGVAVGDVGGAATEEVADGAVADAVALGSRQVGDRREPDGTTRRHDRIAAGGARRQQVPTGEPQGEVAAGRVADDGDVVDVEAMVGADRSE